MTPSAPKRARSRGRRAAVIAAALAVAATVALSGLLLVDIYLHGRYQRSAGFNVWGYRGAPAGRKRAGEYRVVVLGGSTAYGYGVLADDAWPAALERQLRARADAPWFTVINLAYNNEGAYSFKPTLIDYDFLDEDLVVLYEGYNDLAGGGVTNVQVFRHDSPIFRLTGYMPIFPIIFKEKAGAMLHGGDANGLYRHDKTVFHASLATRTAAGVLDATASVAQSLEAQLGKVAVEPAHQVDDAASSGCSRAWQAYCRSITVAVEYARQRGRQAIVVTQPYLPKDADAYELHMGQQKDLAAMLRRRFGSDPDVRYVDLGVRVNLKDPLLAFDNVHLTERGNEQLAGGLVDPVVEMARRRK